MKETNPTVLFIYLLQVTISSCDTGSCDSGKRVIQARRIPFFVTVDLASDTQWQMSVDEGPWNSLGSRAVDTIRTFRRNP